jgi:hypothetical protein
MNFALKLELLKTHMEKTIPYLSVLLQKKIPQLL